MDYLWYSHKQAHHGSGKAMPSMPRSGFNNSARAYAGPEGDIVFYLDDDGEPHKVSSVSHSPDSGPKWDDTELVAKAEKATWIGGTNAGLSEAGRSFCTRNYVPATVEGLLSYIDNRIKFGLQRKLKVGHALKLGKKA